MFSPSPSSSSSLKGQASLLRQERREDHPLRAGPSHTAAPSPRPGASSRLCRCSGPCTGLGAIVRTWSLCFLGGRDVAKNVNSQRSVSTARVYFSTTFWCFSFLPADLITLLCPLLLNSFICWANAYVFQPTTALGPSYLCDPCPPICSGEIPPPWSQRREAPSSPGVTPWLRWVLHTHISRRRPQPCFFVIAPTLCHRWTA